MFEVGGSYANRKGRYTVVGIEGPKMTVRYEDGTMADLNINIQHRIWENIVSEEEAKTLSRSIRAARMAAGYSNQHFIRPVSLLAAEELTIPGWHEEPDVGDDPTLHLRRGDRLIYYDIESQVFFAVATVTATSTEDGKEGTALEGETQPRRFSVDLDARANDLDNAVPLDSVELESQPGIKQLVARGDPHIRISEDDFELLAELLTEVTVDEAEEDEDEDEEEYDEE